LPILNEPAELEPPIPEADPTKVKAERKAAKKAAAAERAAARARLIQERATARAAEKAKVAAEKAEQRDKEKAAQVQKDKEDKERLEREKADRARERAERERVDRERLQNEKADKERADKVRLEQEKERAEQEEAASTKRTEVKKATDASTATRPKMTPTPNSASIPSQVPLLSKMPKKHKLPTKLIRIPKEDEIIHDVSSTVPSATTIDAPPLPSTKGSSSFVEAISTHAHEATGYSSDSAYSERASLEELLDQIDVIQPWMNLLDHPFFDITKINPAAKMPLEYAPLVHALSALSVGGGSFTNNNIPNGSIDNAVSSFQQLLETLTQTISDLLRLLPRTTWDDSSSFDGVLRDMLKGDDFLDDGGEDGGGRDDEVAALTLALERRARWMEVQLSKLEELHRDINTAAVRAVLSFNDRGWDKHGFVPRMGNTLARFDNLPVIQLEDGIMRPMTADELEQKLIVANEAAVFAETELRESMEKMQGLRLADEDF
jgi:CCR4-NOT transcription complex subunit 4